MPDLVVAHTANDYLYLIVRERGCGSVYCGSIRQGCPIAPNFGGEVVEAIPDEVGFAPDY